MNKKQELWNISIRLLSATKDVLNSIVSGQNNREMRRGYSFSTFSQWLEWLLKLHASVYLLMHNDIVRKWKKLELWNISIHLLSATKDASNSTNSGRNSCELCHGSIFGTYFKCHVKLPVSVYSLMPRWKKLRHGAFRKHFSPLSKCFVGNCRH